MKKPSMNKMMKKVESSAADKRMDKKMGYKEGSAADRAQDMKMARKMMGKGKK